MVCVLHFDDDDENPDIPSLIDLTHGDNDDDDDEHVIPTTVTQNENSDYADSIVASKITDRPSSGIVDSPADIDVPWRDHSDRLVRYLKSGTHISISDDRADTSVIGDDGRLLPIPTLGDTPI
jgi:hypothetical protein